eukprot:CAMPEP_0170523294 /NCGR_PEP_ID=MMETSP0209-20121228/8731_1 /TAXON_ID=665100 ORGANISM="Litonotus pictus, Strain P1" /NCGR_SAMPLE_ID=MMETSP0209 /ASSEMBLY_ACC=CAM_ASM_000301 /LENGTH=412 /DNA_ID=CAMNT_0010811313 /DNA_START=25 /DNA_END=1263 /DNA_ORIENTATION=-
MESKPKDPNVSNKYDLLSKNYKIINKNYLCHLNYVIGSGTFGKVLYCSTLDGKKEYAIKFEKSNVKSSVIEAEYEILQQLRQGEGVPSIAWTGEYKKYKLMVMDLLGPSLDKYFIFCNKKFNGITTSLLGIEMVKRVQYIHSKGFLHRDIKPNNFMLGKFSKQLESLNEKTVYIIDFGLSKEYIDFNTQEHLPFKDGRRFIGTPRYASIGTHLGYRQSRRDDLESIAYILIYFILGELPWQGIKAKSKSEKKEKIMEMKLKTNFATDKRIPKELLLFLDFAKALKYEEKPDYKYIYKQLNQIIAANYEFNDFDIGKHIWEWNTKLLSALENSNSYKAQIEPFNKLYEGYPISSFDEFLKKLNIAIPVNLSGTNLPTNSSTTSNTNPNNIMKDDLNGDFIEEGKGYEKGRVNK